MSVAHLAAEQLCLEEYREYPPRATDNGVTSFLLENHHEQFEVYVTEERDETETLSQAAKLAGFYNARFFYEYMGMCKADLTIGRLRSVFNIEDEQQQLSIFVVSQKKGEIKEDLDIDDLIQVAEQFGKLHALSHSAKDEQFRKTVLENNEVIKDMRCEQLQSSIHENIEMASTQHAEYFRHPSKLREMVESLLNSKKEEEETEGKQKEVLCHGNLTAQSLRFNKGKLVEIVDWDNVHFGNPAQDLSNLIITSSSQTIRRNHFMKIFRTYFYTLVDIRAPKFKLSDLKAAFRIQHRQSVLNSFDSVIGILNSEDCSEERKKLCVRNWETALEDAHSFETGDYISDDEHCFFSN